MNKRDQMRNKRAKAKRQPDGSTRWRTYSLMFVCALTLVSGFFFAARQHFASMDTGMKNSRLRKQVDELEAEKRRLLLAREVSLSPAEIKKAAKKTGLLGQSGNAGEIAQVVSTTKDKALPPPVSETKSMIVKTAAVSPVRPADVVRTTAAVSYPRAEKPAKQQTKAKVSN